MTAAVEPMTPGTVYEQPSLYKFQSNISKISKHDLAIQPL
jgi:hypothetical protein